MGNIKENSTIVTSGDPKEYPNWQSARETNTPLKPVTSDAAHFTADPQGKENKDLKPKER